MKEELFVVSESSDTIILNYVCIIQLPSTSLIHMLDGPMACGNLTTDDMEDEEGFQSQEIFTPEKYAYLYYKALLLL